MPRFERRSASAVRGAARKRSAWLRLLCGAACVWGGATANGAEPTIAAQGLQVTTFLKKHCAGCHNAKDKKADLALESFYTRDGLVRGRKMTESLVEMVHDGTMPPEGKPQPSLAEKEAFIKGIKAILADADRNAKLDPGRVTARRLNRIEYDNTIRDLLYVDVNPAADFPSDDIGHGFDNIGDVLTISPVLMERYLTAAELVVQSAILLNPPKPPVRHQGSRWLEPGGNYPDKPFRPIAEAGKLHTPYRLGIDGEYVFKFRAYGQAPDGKPVKLLVKDNGTLLKEFEIPPGDEKKAAMYELKTQLQPGDHRFFLELAEPFKGGTENARTVFVHFMELTGPADTRPGGHRKLLACDGSKPQAERSREVLTRFASRAYRRPPTKDEVDRLVALAEGVAAEKKSWEAGIQTAFLAVLVSPKFLFRLELDDATAGKAAPAKGTGTNSIGGLPRAKPAADPRPLGDYALASRLSYFLWSSMPDDELFAKAAAKELSKPEVLDAQVKRMLADPKSTALVERFALQWLQLERLQGFSPDPSLFPKFNDRLRESMKQETLLFFGEIVRQDRSILDLIDGNFTYLNGPLAAHYGIHDSVGNRHQKGRKWIQGGKHIGHHESQFTRVEFFDDVRGGLLTQAGILTVTSNPTRTSPVKRGKWVLEQLLGAPPPPPPPNVPELDADKKGTAQGTLRQRLEQHRANPSCASCHAKMDPLGFAFENFDAVGGWRDQDGGQPIDASGELPGGRKFQGPNELKQILKERKDEFARCLTEKLLTYALGRGLEYYDRPAVDKITTALAAGDYKFSVLAAEIAKSAPFRLRRAEEPQR